MTARGRIIQASKYVPKSNGRPLMNTSICGIDSRNIAHRQLPDSLTPSTASCSCPSTAFTSLTEPRSRPSTPLTNVTEPQQRPPTPLTSLTEHQQRLPTPLADYTKPPAGPATAMTRHRPPPALTTHRPPPTGPATALTRHRKPPAGPATALTKQGRRQSPAKLAATGGRCHTGDSGREADLEDLVGGGIVNTGRVPSPACKDRLAKVVQNPTETSEVQVRKPKSATKENILRQLNLEEFPTYWYTTVVPAADVHLRGHARSVRGPDSSVRVQPRPQTVTSRLFCDVSPTTRTRSRLSDVAHSSKPAQHDLFYDAALQRQRDTCRDMEETIRRKVKDFLVSLEDSVKSQLQTSVSELILSPAD